MKRGLRTALVLLVTGLATSAWAQAKHPIAAGFRNVNGGSNMRFQIGRDLPLPITDRGTTLGGPCSTNNYVPGQGNCEGRIFPYPGAFGLPGGLPPATVSATTVNSTGRQLVLHPGLMLGGGTPVNIGVLNDFPGSPLFQVKTNLLLKLPPTLATAGGPATKGLTLRKGRRTGPSTVSWCPGLTFQTQFGKANPNFTYNPGCTHPFVGKVLTGVAGRMVYTKTKNQFGGAFHPGQGVFGTALLALINKYDGALCKGAGCVVSFVYASPPPTGVIGREFGATATSVGRKGRKYQVSGITPSGVITAIGSHIGPANYTNAGTSFGGPWTTGMLTITVLAHCGAGGSEMFTRTGSDARVPGNPPGMSLPVGGHGNISLVSGAVSVRNFTGGNADRGWMTLTLPEPDALTSAAAALLVLVVCNRLARRRAR